MGVSTAPTPLVNSSAETQAVDKFLAAATGRPSALVLEGEPGIGKTTLWLAALQQARERGYRVLSAHPAEAESVLAYAALTDLLSGVEATLLSSLPRPQQIALNRVVLRVGADGEATDQRAVAAGFLSVITGLAEETPVLLAIDNLQWLDPSTVQVLAFAARRFPARASVLGTVRTDPDTASAAAWLRLLRPDAIRRVRVCPLSLGALSAVLRKRIGRSLSRPTLVRIHQISGGNPFYAIELARAMGDAAAGAEVELPGTLAELVRARIGTLDIDVRGVLLAAACLAAPTVELMAAAIGANAQQVVGLLEDAEGNGIVVIDGQRVRFAHPMLAHGVYTGAAPAVCRGMHRRLAEVVEQPELRARHLALAATGADPDALRALDVAAESARLRGAPAAAAELLDLAIGLGGDTPQRRIRLAGHHFDGGDPGRARALLEETIATVGHGVLRAEASNLLGVVHIFGDSPAEAAAVLRAALGDVGSNLSMRVQILVTLSFALLNLGDVTAAVRSVEDAATNAERLGQPHPLSQALGMRVMVRFLAGEGLDEASLHRALALEDRQARMPVAFRPSMQNAMLLAWTGQLERSSEELLSIGRHCIERGEESEWMFVAFNGLITHVWRGKFTEATTVAEDAMERALQMGGDVMLSAALTMRATLAVYAGRVDDARVAAREALAASQRAGSSILAGWPITIVGFLELSVGNYQATLSTLEPLVSGLDKTSQATEIFLASFIPDAAEAMIALGRLHEAAPLVDVLERNGRRLDRAWMLAVGARCRAMLLAARGDVDAAVLAAQQAMAEHERLPMPFERARTQLLVGQLQRRQRHNDAAAATLREALDTFEELATPLWAERARVDLTRANVGPRCAAELTPSEQRVAELAASGMTNRDIAAALFISPKTVESNLARIYRKLGIHTRAELGGHIRPQHIGKHPIYSAS